MPKFGVTGKVNGSGHCLLSLEYIFFTTAIIYVETVGHMFLRCTRSRGTNKDAGGMRNIERESAGVREGEREKTQPAFLLSADAASKTLF